MNKVGLCIIVLALMAPGGRAAEDRATAASTVAPVRRGALALQFDDGWTLWRTDIAPLLKRVGGMATGFVNIQYIENGRITLDELLSLQNEFGWEIGSHGVTHTHAPRHVARHGLEHWMNHEFLPALEYLKTRGLAARHFVYPFNAATPELNRAIMPHVDSFRRVDNMAIATGRRPDGSVPGTAIDLTRHLPLPLLKQWIDAAHRQAQCLFLYGHRVLPDDHFFTATVTAVEPRRLRLDQPVRLPDEDSLVLVPDIARRGLADSLRAFTVNGAEIELAQGDLTRLTAPGATILIGPTYGTRLSDFQALIEYAAPRLAFLRLSDAVKRVAQD